MVRQNVRKISWDAIYLHKNIDTLVILHTQPTRNIPFPVKIPLVATSNDPTVTSVTYKPT